MTTTHKIWKAVGYDAAVAHVRRMNTDELFFEEYWSREEDEKEGAPGVHRIVLEEIEGRFRAMEKELNKAVG